MSYLEYYKKFGAQPPDAVNKGHLIYEVVHGSRAYGCNRPDSDFDMYGICIPSRPYVFSHEFGVIPGFGDNPYIFEHYEQQKLKDSGGKEASFHIYNIVRFFDLALRSTPNIIESLFVPQVNITHITQIGHLIRNNRKLFLSKLCVQKMRAYAISQSKKLETKNPIGTRKEYIKKYGMDVKFALNLIRLLLETEQILLEGDLDLTRNGKLLFGIRNGEWDLKRVQEFAYEKEKGIEKLILTSSLQAKPDESKIRDLLLECLEIQYKNIPVVRVDESTVAIKKIKEILEKINV